MEKKDAIINAPSHEKALQILTTDVNVEVVFQTGFRQTNVSRNHIAEADVDEDAMKKVFLQPV